jgi:hypothetical protein
MARLYRPTIPVEIKCRVALRQLGEAEPDNVIKANRPRRDAGYMVGVVGLPGRSLGRLLERLLDELAESLHCKVEDLRLDHDPPLAARPQERRGLGKKTYYVPDANDPEHLFYRPHGAEFDGSHLIKTNVRGEHGQHPDRVLIKKFKRLERGPRQKPKRKWASKSFPKGRSFRKPNP